MLNFLVSRLSAFHVYSRRTQLGFLHRNDSLTFKSVSSIVELSESDQGKQKIDEYESFKVSYLMNSCGLSHAVAIQVSKLVKLKDPAKADSVLNLLRSYGFSDAQIPEFLKKFPRVLMSNIEETLLPRLRFFQSIGLSCSQIPELLISCPRLLGASLEKRIIPRYEALKSVLDDDEKVFIALKNTKLIIRQVDVTNLVSNIKVVREHGVPQSSITLLVTNFPNVAFMMHEKFAKHLKFVKETGIDPFKPKFIQAIYVSSITKKSTWESKLALFERCGWSRDVTLSVFSKYPSCMMLSEERISNSMKFFVDEMGLAIEDVAKYPALFRTGFKRRIIPRWSVIKVLKKNGLVKENMCPISAFKPSEEEFLKKFVFRFQESIPQLLNIYKDSLPPIPEDE